MSQAIAVSTSATPREEEIQSVLRAIFTSVTGMEAADVGLEPSFLELGADSLALLQVSQEVQHRFGVKIPFRRLLDEITSIGALAAHIEAVLPPPVAAAAAPTVAVAAPSVVAARPAAPVAAVETTEPQLPARGIERIIAQQLAMMTQQLELLRSGASVAPAPVAAPELVPAPPVAALAPRETAPAAAPPAAQKPREAYVAYQSIQKGPGGSLTARQREHLDGLIARLTARTAGSKRLAQTHRGHWADSTNSAKFRLPWKEICYPIVAERGAGSRIWDVDGNEYVDVAMGFGSLLFGHSPSFVVEAMRRQMETGAQVGPQSPLPGEVARLVAELTGVERVAFCNSGTEAVMTALRLARTVTGRTKVAVFAGSFHGTFDGVLVRAAAAGPDTFKALPMAPGVPPHMIEDVLILPYNSLESVARLEAHAHELAAVLVEPFQSRQPDDDPRTFVHALRDLTRRAGAALIFDEIIVGFRMHPGGAQALLGVEADIVTYGKAVGAGHPIGVVAGQRRYLDAIDGGAWSFGDDSVPEAATTYFAGTFFKHPLVMAAARATLEHLKAAGPALQEGLGRRTRSMVGEINAWSEAEGVPIRAVSCGSLFRFAGDADRSAMELFYFHLLEKGIYVPETRVLYLSSAHTDADVERLVAAYREAVLDMRAGGFLPDRPASGPRWQPVRTLPMTHGQKGLWAVSQLGSDAARAYNEPLALRLGGTLDAAALRRALAAVVGRHEALRTTFDPGGELQRIVAEMPVEVPIEDFSLLAPELREEAADAWMTREITAAFDLEKGPLFRFRLARLADDDHRLLLVIHHLVIDGWSFEVVLRDLAQVYEAETRGTASALRPAVPFSTYALGRSEEGEGEPPADAESYWLGEFAGSVAPLELPADRPRPVVQTYRGEVESAVFDPALSRAVRTLAGRQHTTPFVTLLAAFTATLHRVTGQDDVVVGFHSAGQAMLGEAEAVGFCIEMLPLRSGLHSNERFLDHLAATKKRVAGAERYRHYPLGRLVQRLKLKRDPSRPPLVSAIFNMDRWTPPTCWADLAVEVVPVPVSPARFDLLWNVVESPDGLSLAATYNADLFDPLTVRGWMRQFEALLRIVAEQPEIGVEALAARLAEEASREARQGEQALLQARRQAMEGLKGRRAAGVRR
jgi:glutamate-1-semialdehyde aminotransferase/acyl carrier protein